MRLLLVEDDEEIVSIFRVEAEAAGDELIAVRSRDEAIAQLDNSAFDLIVCDLRIPSRPDALDEDATHGRAVLTASLGKHPGTPIVGFSAFGSMPLMQELLRKARQEDYLGEGVPREMLAFFTKDELPDCIELVRYVSRSIQELSEVEIATGVTSIELTRQQAMILRLYARRLGATVVRAQPLAGGLSGSLVLRLRLEAGGAHVASVVAKLDEISRVRDENHRVETLVAPVLLSGSYPNAVTLIAAGAGSIGGLFYRLADGFDRSLFDAIRQGSDAQSIVDALRLHLQPWRDGAPVVRLALSDVRRLMVADEDVPASYADELDVSEVTFDAARCTSHCDLHIFNVLVSRDEMPMVIDFGEVGSAPPSIDPITLELSPIFHPDSVDELNGWPSVGQTERWDDLASYLDACPFPKFVSACRTWAFEVAAGDREVFAVLHAYAARQLKFPDTQHDLALALVSCARRRLGV
jgi:CheY-like chemotaxis protein